MYSYSVGACCVGLKCTKNVKNKCSVLKRIHSAIRRVKEVNELPLGAEDRAEEQRRGCDSSWNERNTHHQTKVERAVTSNETASRCCNESIGSKCLPIVISTSTVLFFCVLFYLGTQSYLGYFCIG